jgi:Tol biopolymer transport system component
MGADMIGRTLAQFRVLEQVGAGGMGAVYRARDTRLDRFVALKVLPPDIAGSPEMLARFHREAKSLAAVQHEGIASIHGIEEVDGVSFLVLEFVEGETLEARLSRGRVGVVEALNWMREVAEAVAVAHERGIAHRDLKPANIMLTPRGRVKVLDFGLAKNLSTAGAGSPGDPTITLVGTLTRPGQVMGTASYMSPEQARGDLVDARADVWAFGCVLYEALAGRRAFDEPTPTGTLAAILRDDPDWGVLPAATPPSVRRLLRRCLYKDAGRRLRSLADARLDLEDAIRESTAPGGARGWWSRSPWWRTALVALGILGALAAGFGLRGITGRSPRPAREVRNLSVSLPAGDILKPSCGLALSPDGRQLVYGARRQGKSLLFLRDLRLADAVPLAESETGYAPFFSPDGNWIGFLDGELLRKVPAVGGAPVTVCEAPGASGGAWGNDGTIVLAMRNQASTLARVSADGGVARPIPPEPGDSVRVQEFGPSFVPHPGAVLVARGSGFLYEAIRVVGVDLGSGRRRELGVSDSPPFYVQTGHILFARGRSLFALPFDPGRMRGRGDPVVVAADLWKNSAPEFAVSGNGTLAYIPSSTLPDSSAVADRTPVWVDRTGAVTPVGAPHRPYALPNIAPDGRRIAFSVLLEKSIANWVYSIDRGILSRLSFDGNDHLPIWSPDGRQVAFASDRAGAPNLYLVDVDGAGPPERLTHSEYHQCPSSWSSDGRYLVYVEARPDGNQDILYLDLRGDRTPHPFLCNPCYESQGMISPDGRWIAYSSSRSGRVEVYLSAFPGGRPTLQLSADGGWQPMWSRDGREVYYVMNLEPSTNSGANAEVMAVSIEAGGESRPGRPRSLFRGRFRPHPGARANYDVSPDRQRFLFTAEGPEYVPPREIRLVLGLAGDLTHR